MRRGHFVRLAFLVCSLAACGDRGAERIPGDPAAERAGAAEAFEAYDLETLAWYREGRPIEFAGREWIPVGQQLAAPRSTFERVGEFEGMGLYAIIDDAPPHDTLFIPVEGGLWQPLEPRDAVIGHVGSSGWQPRPIAA